MKIACEGWVEKDSGSVGSAGFFVIRELLERGHEIDFFTIQDFVKPAGLFGYRNFSYHPTRIDWVEKTWPMIHSMPEPFKKYFTFAFSQISMRLYYRKIAARARENHANRDYDLLFFFGKPAYFTLEGKPTVAWLQGPPQTEWEALRGMRDQIRLLCGLWEFWMLKCIYLYMGILAKIDFAINDTVICGSHWAKEKLMEYGIREKKIETLPYPIDLNRFCGVEKHMSKHNGERKVLLWLGRIVPRKRLDLLLDALASLVQERGDIELKIFGTFSYAKGFKKLIDRFPYRSHLVYKEHIDRSEVIDQIRHADLVIQSSENENFGSAVAEALCCGTPVVVGPTNGTRDYLSDSSFVFDAYDCESLKKTILKALAASERRREQMAIEERKAAEAHFDVIKVVDRLEDIFRKAVSGPDPLLGQEKVARGGR